MDPNELKDAITTFFANLAPVIGKIMSQPRATAGYVTIKGDRFIAFLKACPDPATQHVADAIDPEAVYQFFPDSLRDLARAPRTIDASFGGVQ